MGARAETRTTRAHAAGRLGWCNRCGCGVDASKLARCAECGHMETLCGCSDLRRRHDGRLECTACRIERATLGNDDITRCS